MLASWVLIAAVAASPSSAGKVDELHRYLNAAASLYDALEYERALTQVDRARTRSKRLEDDVLVALYEGIILAHMGRADDARAAFRSALSLNPEAELPLQVSPRVRTDFEAVRAQILKAAGNPPGQAAKSTSTPPAPAPAASPPTARAAEPHPAPSAAPVASAPAATATREEAAGSVKPWAVVPAAAGAVLAGVGTYLMVQSANDWSLLENSRTPLPLPAAHYRDEGQTFQTAGVALVAAGAAGVVAGALIQFTGAPAAVTLAPTRGGAALAIAGHF